MPPKLRPNSAACILLHISQITFDRETEPPLYAPHCLCHSPSHSQKMAYTAQSKEKRKSVCGSGAAYNQIRCHCITVLIKNHQIHHFRTTNPIKFELECYNSGPVTNPV